MQCTKYKFYNIYLGQANELICFRRYCNFCDDVTMLWPLISQHYYLMGCVNSSFSQFFYLRIVWVCVYVCARVRQCTRVYAHDQIILFTRRIAAIKKFIGLRQFLQDTILIGFSMKLIELVLPSMRLTICITSIRAEVNCICTIIFKCIVRFKRPMINT